jgi:hypothetical protein
MADWSRHFDEPISVPGGGELRTLLDAGRYVEALPESQHEQLEWQTATHFLLMAAEGRLSVMFANAALFKALNARQLKTASARRKKAAKTYRVVR